MNFSMLSIFGLLIFLTCVGLAVFISIFGKFKIHKIWAFFNISVAVWGLGMFFIGYKNADLDKAIIWWKIAHIGGYLLPISFLHTMMEFASVKRRKILFFLYFQASFFILLFFFNAQKYSFEYMFNSFYYIQILTYAVYPISAIFWVSAIIYGFFILIKSYQLSTGIKRNQARYLFFSTLIGFIGGGSHFLPACGINI